MTRRNRIEPSHLTAVAGNDKGSFVVSDLLRPVRAMRAAEANAAKDSLAQMLPRSNDRYQRQLRSTQWKLWGAPLVRESERHLDVLAKVLRVVSARDYQLPQ